MNYLFELLIFPGFVFIAAISLALESFYRKFRARMQNRRGPSIFQPFYDLIKLLSKESIVPRKSNFLFTLCPVLMFFTVVAIPLFLPLYNKPVISFSGDLILIIYLFTTASLLLALTGFSQGNPFGAIGGSRELSLLFSLELPLIIVIVTVAIKTGTLTIAEIANYQGNEFLLFSLPLSFVSMFFILPGEIAIAPFDIPEAEQEIVGGVIVELSGWRLALIELSRQIKTLSILSLFITLFLFQEKFLYYLIFLIILIFLMTYIKVVSARLRTEQAFRFYWSFVAILAIVEFLRVVV
ncbi:MAG: respiratory chain complex I subunit 1 family protein [Candidatus Methanofastidiosia archaeon]